MRILYLDAPSGVAGNMLLGAFVDLGVPIDHIEEAFAAVGLPELRLAVTTRDTGNAIYATHVALRIGDIPADAEDAGGDGEKHDAAAPHRAWASIRAQLENSDLREPVKQQSLAIFARLAVAEARVHGVPLETVHFHELGAIDAIGDIVGAVTALDYLDVEQVVCSPLPLGRGEIATRHGLIPLPAPATLYLLEDAAVYGVDEAFEFVTPTGAAVVRTVASAFGAVPAMEIRAVGHGAGSRRRAQRPNLLRVLLGDSHKRDARPDDGFAQSHQLVELHANVDDMIPELFGALRERLTTCDGVLDVWWTPATMKDGRPGVVLSCLVAPANVDAAKELILAESTTLGVRQHTCSRTALARTSLQVETPYGSLTIKVGGDKARIINVAPEYRDVRAAALRAKKPLKEVYAAAVAAAYREGVCVGAPWDHIATQTGTTRPSGASGGAGSAGEDDIET